MNPALRKSVFICPDAGWKPAPQGIYATAMKYRRLGSTNLRVSVIGIGTWQFGGE